MLCILYYTTICCTMLSYIHWAFKKFITMAKNMARIIRKSLFFLKRKFLGFTICCKSYKLYILNGELLAHHSNLVCAQIWNMRGAKNTQISNFAKKLANILHENFGGNLTFNLTICSVFNNRLNPVHPVDLKYIHMHFTTF